MKKRKIKYVSYIVISVFLTLGLSLSLQSIFAEWEPPTNTPPNDNVPGVIDVGSDPQGKAGILSIGGIGSDIANYAFRVLTGKVGIGTTSPNSLLHLKTTDADANNAEIDIQSGDEDHWAIYHDKNSEDLRFWNGGNNRVVIEKDGQIKATDPTEDYHLTTRGWVVDAMGGGGGFTYGELEGVYYSVGGDNHYCEQYTIDTGVKSTTGINYGRICDSSLNYTCDENKQCNEPDIDIISTSKGDTSCALTKSKNVKCWGDNDYGQLGDGTNDDKEIPVLVSGLNNVVSISAHTHSCASLMDGSIRCWGRNLYGQLGDGTNVNKDVPVPVFGISNSVSVTGGDDDYQCAIVVNGLDKNVMCWGRGNYGKLGNGSDSDSNIPVSVSVIDNAESIDSSYENTCAVLGTGQIWCWGHNTYGQLGDGTTGNYRNIPVRASGISNAVGVSAGNRFTCAVLSSGDVKCWSISNGWGQLGVGSFDACIIPGNCPSVSLSDNAIAVSTGEYFACALLVNGEIQCWGRNNYGQLGVGHTTTTPSPSTVKNITNAKSIITGDSHACAVLDDDSMKCWGFNYNGEFADGGLVTASTLPR